MPMQLASCFLVALAVGSSGWWSNLGTAAELEKSTHDKADGEQLASEDVLFLIADELAKEDELHGVEPFTGQTDHGSRVIHKPEDSYTIYQNLWLHSGRFYAIVDQPEHPEFCHRAKLGKNIELACIPFPSAQSLYSNTKARWLPGVTLFIDFPFFAYPDNFGHWLEILVPLYSVLSDGSWRATTSGQDIDTIFFTNIPKDKIQGIGWIWNMLAVALSPSQKQPKLIFPDALGKLEKDAWLGMEFALVVHNRYTDGKQNLAFPTTSLAQQFRQKAYALAQLPLPETAATSITFMTSPASEVVVNQQDLLRDFGNIARKFGWQNRPYSATSAAPFTSFVSAMSRTGVLIARHGPLLANLILLPPGATIIELLPYNWDWEGASTLYKNLTESMGDINYYSWKATTSDTAVYTSARGVLYRNWTEQECISSDCIAVHAEAGMYADRNAIENILVDTLSKQAYESWSRNDGGDVTAQPLRRKVALI